MNWVEIAVLGALVAIFIRLGDIARLLDSINDKESLKESDARKLASAIENEINSDFIREKLVEILRYVHSIQDEGIDQGKERREEELKRLMKAFNKDE